MVIRGPHRWYRQMADLFYLHLLHFACSCLPETPIWLLYHVHRPQVTCKWLVSVSATLHCLACPQATGWSSGPSTAFALHTQSEQTELACATDKCGLAQACVMYMVQSSWGAHCSQFGTVVSSTPYSSLCKLPSPSLLDPTHTIPCSGVISHSFGMSGRWAGCK